MPRSDLPGGLPKPIRFDPGRPLLLGRDRSGATGGVRPVRLCGVRPAARALWIHPQGEASAAEAADLRSGGGE